jgi:hypothetical protein
MAVPTRLQIEAGFALPKYKVEVLNHAGVWYTVLNARVANISGSADSTGNQDNGVSFGTPSDPSASIEMENYQVDGIRYMHDPYWINKPARISFGFDTSDFVTIYQGPIKNMNRSNDMITLELGGSLDYLADVKIHTPIYYRKAAATKTTIASQENPDGIGYNAGLINLAFWRAGGRPLEQQGILYTEASADWKFWYSCEQSLIAPDYSWYSGDNTQDEVYTLARAVGGQIYQDTLGTVRYTQPLSFGDMSGYVSFYTFTDAVFDGYSEAISKGELVGTLKMLHTPRRVEPMKHVIEDKTPRLIHPWAVLGQSEIIELSPSLPIWQYQGLYTNNDLTATTTMKAQLLDNRPVTPTIGAVEAYANKILITVSNPDSTTPMIITSIKVQGRPLAAMDDVLTQYPQPGDAWLPEKIVENNVYVQNEIHAKRLIRMIFDFYNELRPIITLNNVQYDPDRFVGEIVKLSSRYNNDSFKHFRIIKIAHSNLGTSMSVDLVQVNTVPKRSDMFIIGTSYSSGDTKQLSY